MSTARNVKDELEDTPARSGERSEAEKEDSAGVGIEAG